MHEFDWVQPLIMGVGTVVWWLLRSKDEQQSNEIATLWAKHDEDAKELMMLKLKVEGEHYKKVELDSRFEKLEHTFQRGFDNLGAKFDTLANALMVHMQKEDERQHK